MGELMDLITKETKQKLQKVKKGLEEHKAALKKYQADLKVEELMLHEGKKELGKNVRNSEMKEVVDMLEINVTVLKDLILIEEDKISKFKIEECYLLAKERYLKNRDWWF